MRRYAELRAQHMGEMEEARMKEVSDEIEKRLECEFKLHKSGDDIVTALRGSLQFIVP